MTVLFFSRLFYPHIGGVEKHVMEVGKRLSEDGHKVIVFSEELGEYKGKRKSGSGKINGIEYYQIPVGQDDWFKKYRIWKYLWMQRKFIQNADIVHCHDVFFWYLPFRLLYPNKRVFTTFHGYETHYPPRWQAKVVRKISEKLSSGNICIGEFISKWYGTKPTIVSYGGVALPKKPSLYKNSHSALFVGRLEKQTAFPVYEKAYEILKQKFPKFQFFVLGDGSLKPNLGKDITLEETEYIDPYLEKSHFFFASGYLSMLEAFSYRRPVIAVYEDPIKKDYLTMTPFAKWMTIVENAEDVVEAVSKLLANSLLEKENSESAYMWAKKQTWDKVASDYKKLWHI